MAEASRIWRQAAPVEHGAWAFLCLPLVAGLGHRPTTAGIWAAGMILAAFLAKRPVERWFRGLREPGYLPGGLLIIAACCLGMVVRSGGTRAWPLFLGQGALGAAAWWMGRRLGVRSLTAETLGALSLLLGGGTVLAAGGAPLSSALSFVVALLALALPPLFVLRRRLARNTGRPCSDPTELPLGASLLSVLILLIYWQRGWAHAYLPLWASLLALRALPLPSPRRAKTLGVAEGFVQLGHLCAVLWALGV